jgi:hypothetical protein
MAELTRPSRWKMFRESARAHKGLILIILIILVALILITIIYQEKNEVTGQVVKDPDAQPPLQESRDAKTTYNDVVVNSIS